MADKDTASARHPVETGVPARFWFPPPFLPLSVQTERMDSEDTVSHSDSPFFRFMLRIALRGW